MSAVCSAHKVLHQFSQPLPHHAQAWESQRKLSIDKSVVRDLTNSTPFHCPAAPAAPAATASPSTTKPDIILAEHWETERWNEPKTKRRRYGKIMKNEEKLGKMGNVENVENVGCEQHITSTRWQHWQEVELCSMNSMHSITATSHEYVGDLLLIRLSQVFTSFNLASHLRNYGHRRKTHGFLPGEWGEE